MRCTGVILTISVLAVLFVSVGVVSALDQNQASVTTFPSSQNVNRGQTVGITLIFTNNSPDTLILTNVGVHFDWMDSGGFFGFDLKNSPITVQAGSNYPFTQPINIQVPTTATAGQHTYYVGVDGTQGTANTPFSWDSPTSIITVGSSVVPTGTSNPTAGGGSQGGGQDLLLYGVLSAIVVILVLVIVFLVMRMRKKPAVSPPAVTSAETAQTDTPTTPDENPAPEQKTDKTEA